MGVKAGSSAEITATLMGQPASTPLATADVAPMDAVD
jgi:hypothetical protein